MTDILHVQTRAYPTLHEQLEMDLPASVSVDKFGTVEPRASKMGSLAYGEASMVDVDLRPLLQDLAVPDEVKIVQCRLRALWSGVVLLSYGLRHRDDLRALTTLELADVDARVNRELHQADQELIAAVLGALDEKGVLVGVDWPGRPLAPSERGAAGHHLPGEVRYNCHLVSDGLFWEADARILGDGDLAGSSTCRPLLPYTFAWRVDTPDDFNQVLACLEGTDIAVAQRSVLAAASNDAVHLLEHLADTEPAELNLGNYRRYLDRIRACYHRLDSYRYDSSQEHRGAYLAARREMGLDGIHDRAESLLQRVGESLGAAIDEQTQILDQRLNRVAALLTVVASGSFLFDTINFFRGTDPPSSAAREIIVSAIWVSLIMVLVFVAFWHRQVPKVQRTPRRSGRLHPRKRLRP